MPNESLPPTPASEAPTDGEMQRLWSEIRTIAGQAAHSTPIEAWEIEGMAQTFGISATEYDGYRQSDGKGWISKLQSSSNPADSVVAITTMSNWGNVADPNRTVWKVALLADGTIVRHVSVENSHGMAEETLRFSPENPEPENPAGYLGKLKLLLFDVSKDAGLEAERPSGVGWNTPKPPEKRPGHINALLGWASARGIWR